MAAIEGSDLGRWALIFFFIVVPILKSIFEKAKAKGRPIEEDDLDFDDENFELEMSGEEAWKRLIGGDTGAKPAAKVAVPEAPVRPVPVFGGAGRSGLERPTPRTYEDVGSSSVRPPRQPEKSAPHVEHYESIAHLQGFQSSSDSLGQTGGTLGADFAALSERTDVEPKGGRRSRRTAIDWRLAIRTREILGTPVALRTGSAELPGFR